MVIRPVPTVRLLRSGCANRPYFRMVVISQKEHHKSKAYLDYIGWFDPMPNEHGESVGGINFDRVKYWFSRGTRFSTGCEMLLGLAGYFPVHPRSYLLAHRRRKELQEKASAAAQGDSQESSSSETAVLSSSTNNDEPSVVSSAVR